MRIRHDIFTGIGIFITALLGYLGFFGIGLLVFREADDDAPFIGTLVVGIIISLLLATFICNPEKYGYQKITVSENVVEVTE